MKNKGWAGLGYRLSPPDVEEGDGVSQMCTETFACHSLTLWWWAISNLQTSLLKQTLERRVAVKIKEDDIYKPCSWSLGTWLTVNHLPSLPYFWELFYCFCRELRGFAASGNCTGFSAGRVKWCLGKRTVRELLRLCKLSIILELNIRMLIKSAGLWWSHQSDCY